MSKEDTFLILKLGGVENAYRYYLDHKWNAESDTEDYQQLRRFFRRMDANQRIELYYGNRDRVVIDGS